MKKIKFVKELNKDGATILQMCDGAHSIEEIVRVIKKVSRNG